MTSVPTTLEKAVELARSKKALDLRILDLRGLVPFTDFFVIMTAASVRQSQAIADALVDGLRSDGVRARHIEGYTFGEWVLIDFGDFVAHVFAAEKRSLYALERLWRDAPVIELNGAA